MAALQILIQKFLPDLTAFTFNTAWVAGLAVVIGLDAFRQVDLLHLIRVVVVALVAGILCVAFDMTGFAGDIARIAVIEWEGVSGQRGRRPGLQCVAAYTVKAKLAEVHLGFIMTGDAQVRVFLRQQAGAQVLQFQGRNFLGCIAIRGSDLLDLVPIGKTQQRDQFANLVVVEYAAFLQVPGSHRGTMGSPGDNIEEHIGVGIRHSQTVEGRVHRVALTIGTVAVGTVL